MANNSQRKTLALQLVSMKQPAPPVRKRITHSECINFRDRENIRTNIERQKVGGPFTEPVLQTHLHIFIREMLPKNWNKCTQQRFKSNYTNNESCTSHQMAVSVVLHASGTTATFFSILFPCFFQNVC